MLMHEGRNQLAAQQYAEAAESFDRAIEEDPNLQEAYTLGARAWWEKDRDNPQNRATALNKTRKAAELNPKDAHAYGIQGEIYEYEGKVDEAIKAYETSLSLAPNNARYLMSLGVLYYRQKQFAKAAAAFTSAWDADPKMAKAGYNAGVAYLNAGMSHQAEEILTRVVAADPQNGTVHIALGSALERNGKTAQAIESYKNGYNCSAAVSQKADAAAKAGVLYFNEGNYADAEIWLNNSLIVAKEPKTEHNLARVYVEQGRAAEALPYARAAADAEPQNAVYAFTLAQAFEAAGETESAVSSYQKAVELNPGYLDAMINLGALYDRLQRYAEAESILKTAVAEDESNFEAWNNLGNVYYHQKKNDAAVDAYKKARTLRPNDTTVIYQTALACFDAGRIADAERAFLDLIEADPQNAEAYNDLGNLYFQAGEIDKAKDCYRKVLEINPRHPNRSRIEQRIYQ